MSREQLNFPPPQQQIRFIQNNQQSHQIYSDYGIPMNLSEVKSSNESLKIYNGSPIERQVYRPFEQATAHEQNVRVAKSTSQKALPIIYNAYNDKGQEHHLPPLPTSISPRQGNSLNRQSKQQTIKAQNDQFEENHSEVYQYRDGLTEKEEYRRTGQDGIHTFNYLPPQSEPPTSHFIELPSEHPEYTQQRQTQYEYSNSSYQNERNQGAHYLNLPEERYNISHSKSPSRGIQGQHSNVPPSPRMKYEPFKQALAMSDSSARLIQIPQDQYQKFIDHLPKCRQAQEQIGRLRGKNEELGQKQHFYWQENMTLREQNKRLRDLVNHFQKRQKELLKEKEDFKEECTVLVNRYRQSLLEEFGLLFERYRLQMQRSK